MALSLDKHRHDFQSATVRAIPPGAQVERFIDPAAVLQLVPGEAATVRRLEKLRFLKEVAQPEEGMAGFEPVLAALRLRYPDAQFLSRGEGGFMWGDETHQLRCDWVTGYESEQQPWRTVSVGFHSHATFPCTAPQFVGVVMALEQSGYTIIECKVKGAKQAARAALAPIAHLLKNKPAALFQEWMSKATTDLSEALDIQGMPGLARKL